MDERIKYWVDLSDYDIETAAAMLESKRYLYVGFMCHLAVEKQLKAFFIKICGEHPPKTHNLRMLAKKCGIYDHFNNEQVQLLLALEALNIESRYPTDKEKLSRSLSRERCMDILHSSRNLLSWIKNRLKISQNSSHHQSVRK